MANYKYKNVKVDIRDGIAWVILNRPEKRNAMSPQLHYDMDDALAQLEVDDDAKVIVVTGAGGNFSAGQDLKEFFRELDTNPAARRKAAARPPIAGAGNGSTITTSRPSPWSTAICVGGAFMQLLATDFALRPKRPPSRCRR